MFLPEELLKALKEVEAVAAVEFLEALKEVEAAPGLKMKATRWTNRGSKYPQRARPSAPGQSAPPPASPGP